MRCFFIAALALCLLLPLAAAAQSEPVPGAACSNANRFMNSGGPENAGSLDLMFCNGATWDGIVRYTSTGNTGIRTTSPAAPLHVKGEAIVGHQGLACAAATAGAIRYNSAQTRLEFCNGTNWTVAAQVQGSQPPTAPSGSGYWVLSSSSWDGNMGGLSGADAKCLTELTTYTTWNGYSDANSRGLLNSTHVHAFLCDVSACRTPMPLTTYYFARVGDASAGGASFTTDSIGKGPGDAQNWSAANRFSGSYTYWTNRAADACNSDNWTVNPGQACDASYGHCGSWSDNGSGNISHPGTSASIGYGRYTGFYSSCDNSYRLICYVDP